MGSGVVVGTWDDKGRSAYRKYEQHKAGFSLVVLRLVLLSLLCGGGDGGGGGGDSVRVGLRGGESERRLGDRGSEEKDWKVTMEENVEVRGR